MKEDIKKEKKKQFGVPDVEYTRHMNELDVHFKRSSEWTLTPATRPIHDFVGDLFNRYIKDLE